MWTLRHCLTRLLQENTYLTSSLFSLILFFHCSLLFLSFSVFIYLSFSVFLSVSQSGILAKPVLRENEVQEDVEFTRRHSNFRETSYSWSWQPSWWEGWACSRDVDWYAQTTKTRGQQREECPSADNASRGNECWRRNWKRCPLWRRCPARLCPLPLTKDLRLPSQINMYILYIWNLSIPLLSVHLGRFLLRDFNINKGFLLTNLKSICFFVFFFFSENERLFIIIY